MKTLPALFICGFGLAVSAFGQAPGSVEQTFYGVDWTPQAAQTDGKVLIAWDNSRSFGFLIPLRLMMARLNTDGSFDRSFDPGDIVCRPTHDAVADWPAIKAVQADGKILVGMNKGGEGGDLVLPDGEPTPLVRLNSDGSLDSSFRYLGPVPVQYNLTVVPLPNGSMFAGSVRLQSDGSVDSSFKPQIEGCAGDENSWGVAALQPDGRILVISPSWGRVCGPSVFRLLPDGSRDPDFQPPITDGDVVWVRVLPDKKILVHGWFREINGQPRSSLARLNSDGSLDEGFKPFLGGPSDYPSDAVMQGDGKIVVVVRFVGQALTQLVRLNSDGSLDSSFSSGLVPQCCQVDEVDLDSFSIRSLVLDTGGSFWVATSYTEKIRDPTPHEHNEVTRLYGDLPGLRLSAPKRLPNGTFEISCAGTAGRNVVLEATSSIMPALWQPVATNTLFNGSTTFNAGTIDTAKSSQHFYRAVFR